MSAQYFVYTRGYGIANDYKLLFSPSEDFCPSDIRKYFLQQVRGLINLDTYVGNLEDNPRWILSKKDGFTLWGVGVMNKKLSNTNNIDYSNRPVRGFFGFILKEESLSKLPFDIAFFEHFYSKYIIDLWNVSKEDFKKKGVELDIDIENYRTITPNNSNLALNTDENKTVLFEDSIFPEDFFSTALGESGNFSCVYGLEEKNHAFDHKYKFYNVIVKGVGKKEVKIYKSKEEIKETTVSHPVTTEESYMPKNGYSLKLLIIGGIAVLAILTLMVGRCSKSNQTNPQKSASGDPTQVVKKMHKK